MFLQKNYIGDMNTYQNASKGHNTNDSTNTPDVVCSKPKLCNKMHATPI